MMGNTMSLSKIHISAPLGSPLIVQKNLIAEHVNLIFYEPLYRFVRLFERAFNEHTFQQFGNTQEERDFLKCIPADFPDALNIPHELRFSYYVQQFLIIFNHYSDYQLNIIEVLPYLSHCKDWKY